MTINDALWKAHKLAREKHETHIVTEGCGGCFVLSEPDYYAQDDRDTLVGRVYPDGRESWSQYA